MAGKLKPNERIQLKTWIGGGKRFKLLYSVSRDGCSSTIFHQKCDNQGPTVSVLYNTDGTIFGGYTANSWNSTGTFYNDVNAFLFRLQYNGTSKPAKFIRNGKGKDVSCQSNYGPTFGNDLHTFSGNINYIGNSFPLNGHLQPGNSYDMQGENANSFANGNLQVTDLEVYQACESTRDDPFDVPWRETPEWNTGLMQKLKDYVENYKPLRGLKIEQAKIILVGQIGSGKSSFFNTINSLFRGYVTSQACSGSSEHSLTTQYRMYQVRNGGNGKPLNFRLCDTRGLEEDQGLDSVEMSHLLDGNVPDHFLFNPSSTISPEVPGFISSPKLGDQIHCVAFVVDASTVDVIPEKVVERIRSLQASINRKGVPQVVLMTKIDKICQPLSGDVSKAFYMPSILEHVEKVAQVMGLPRAHVLPVKNYESEMELDENINILSLFAMQKILQFANDYLYNSLDELEADQRSIKDKLYGLFHYFFQR